MSILLECLSYDFNFVMNTYKYVEEEDGVVSSVINFEDVQTRQRGVFLFSRVHIFHFMTISPLFTLVSFVSDNMFQKLYFLPNDFSLC